MKQLTCELCEGTDFVKEDGFFVCQNCGTKYSLAEAKQLMSGEAAPAAPKAGNSAVVNNYLTMAESALDSNNNAEAENYANKVLELDPANSKAWEIKGRAAGWQSKTNNSRIPEAAKAFMFAVEYAAAEDKAEMRVRVGNAFVALAKAMVNLHCENFGELPDADHAQKIISSLNDSILLMNDMVAKSCVGFNRASFYNDIARTMNNCACDGYKKARDDFGPEHRNMAKWQWERFTGQCDACLKVLDRAIELARESSLGVQICDNYKVIGEAARDSCSWKFNVNSWNADNYDRDFSFTDSAKKARTDAINNFMKKKDVFNKDQHKAVMKNLSGAREKSEIAAGREKYWQEHAEEKERLNARDAQIKKEQEDLKKKTAELDSKIRQLDKQLNGRVPAMGEKEQLKDRISKLETELRGLGLFKGKEKKALRAQIEELSAQMPQIDEKIKEETKEQNAPILQQKAEVKAEIDSCKNKTAELKKEADGIKEELTKSRGKLDTAGAFELKGAIVDGKYAVTYTQFMDHLKRIVPAPYEFKPIEVEGIKLSSHIQNCRKSIIIDPTLSGDNKNTGCLIYFELEPDSDIIKTIMLTGPRSQNAKEMNAWCMIGALILLSLSPETSRDNAEEIFADLAFSETNSWYGEHDISIEYADYILIELMGIALRNSCAVIRPNC